MQITKISAPNSYSAAVTKPMVCAISDELALDTLKKELSGKMNDKEIKTWTDRVISICKQMKIEPKQLPISQELPGNLTREQNREFYKYVLDTIV
ncbi:hypothetical protein IKQ26_05940 [bacterium]|nr:hypothetical protein [bacterium]